jgi:hypothetical protein
MKLELIYGSNKDKIQVLAYGYGDCGQDIGQVACVNSEILAKLPKEDVNKLMYELQVAINSCIEALDKTA